MRIIFRCFVTRNNEGNWKCYHDQCKEASQGRARSALKELNGAVQCMHINSVLEDRSHLSDTNQKYTQLSSAVLKDVPFPPAILAEFESHIINNNLDKIIHRVSNDCFVVQTTPSSEAPLGLLHVRVDRKRKFHCSCNKFKRISSFCGATTAPRLSNRCAHIYICLWLVFSNNSLKDEFSFSLFDESKSGKVL